MAPGLDPDTVAQLERVIGWLEAALERELGPDAPALQLEVQERGK